MKASGQKKMKMNAKQFDEFVKDRIDGTKRIKNEKHDKNSKIMSN